MDTISLGTDEPEKYENLKKMTLFVVVNYDIRKLVFVYCFPLHFFYMSAMMICIGENIRTFKLIFTALLKS